MKIVATSVHSLCLEHDYMLFLVPLPLIGNKRATYVDRCGVTHRVLGKSVYGVQIRQIVDEYVISELEKKR